MRRSWFAMCLGLFLLFLMAPLDLVADDKAGPEDLSQAQKERFEPLFKQFEETYEAKDYPNALKQLTAITKALEKELGPTHFIVMQANIGFVMIYAEQKRYKDADGVFTELMARLKKAKLGESSQMLYVLVSQVDYLKNTGKEKQAAEVEKQIAALLKKYPEYAEMLKKDQGDDQNQNGDNDAFKKFKPIFEQIWQLRDEGYYEMALGFAKSATENTSREYGADAEISLAAKRILAEIYQLNGQEKEAYSVLKTALQELKDTSKPTMETIFLLEKLADLARQQGDGATQKVAESKMQGLLSANAELQKQFAVELSKRKDKPEGGKEGQNGPARNPKADQYYQELNGLEMALKDKKTPAADLLPKLDEIINRATKDLEANDPFFMEAEMRQARYLADSAKPDKALEIINRRIAEAEKKQPIDENRLFDAYRMLGDIQERLNKVDAAIQAYDKAIALGQKLVQGMQGATADKNSDKNSDKNKGKDDGQKGRIEQLNRDLLNISMNVVRLLQRANRNAEADARLKQVNEMVAKNPVDDRLKWEIAINQANALAQSGKNKEADAAYAKLLADISKQKTQDSKEAIQYAMLVVDISDYYQRTGRNNEAQSTAKQAMGMIRAAGDSSEGFNLLARLAGIMDRSKQKPEAAKLYEELIDRLNKGGMALSAQDQGWFYFEYVRFQIQNGKKAADYIPLLQKSLDFVQKETTMDTRLAIQIAMELRMAYEQSGNKAEAQKMVQLSLDLQAKNPEASDPRFKIHMMVQMANEARNQGNMAEAEKLMQQMQDQVLKDSGPNSANYARALIEKFWFNNSNPNTTLDLKGLLNQAIQILEKDPKAKQDPQAKQDLAVALTELAKIQLNRDQDFTKAEPLFKRALDLMTVENDLAEMLNISTHLAMGYLSRKDYGQAEQWFKKGSEFQQGRESNDYWLANQQLRYAQLNIDTNKWTDAETKLKKAEALMGQLEQKDSNYHGDWRMLYSRLIIVYEKLAKADQLKVYQDKLKALN